MVRAAMRTPAMARRVCAGIAAGRTLIAVCRPAGMPNYRSIQRWAREDPDFAARYRAAQETRAGATLRQGVRDPGRGGQPGDYSPKLARRLCALIAGGLSLRDIARRPGLPGRAAVRRWLKGREDFRTIYEAACARRTERLADEALEIAEGALAAVRAAGDGETAVSAREALRWAAMRIGARRWRVGTLTPRQVTDRCTSAATVR